MARSRREFLQLAGSATGSALLVGCDAAAVQQNALAEIPSGAGDGTDSPPSSPPPTSPGAASNPVVTSLKTYLQQHASPTFSLPPPALSVPSISWAGPVSNSNVAPTTLASGVNIAFSNTLISKPLAQLYSASLPGAPQVGGIPCLAVNRQYSCKGSSQSVGSLRTVRIKTNAAVLELSGVVPDDAQTVQTLIVDGYLVPTKVLTCSLGFRGGWDAGTIRINFGSRKMRDIWIESYMFVAYVRIDASDSVAALGDSAEPQITVIGDSYQQCQSAVFGNGAGIPLEVATRLGIRKVATDVIGGTGYYNSNTNLGNFNDRLPAHAQDNSAIYLVMGGLNDYGDRVSNSNTVWPTLAAYDQAVLGYLQGLRARQPNAVIVVTAPFCPIPSLSDSSYISNAATNTTGQGDFLYKAGLFKQSLQQIAGPWIYIDALMGTGWLNSAGASGDVRNLQWLTGGTPAPGTSTSYKPGNTDGGGGGGYGGIASIPVLNGGRYSQGPEVTASGGTGSGLLLSSTIDHATGSLTAINVLVPGCGYSKGAGLPSIRIDTTFQTTPATLGTPNLEVGINPNGGYPLAAWLPEGVSDLNNIYRMLRPELTHPSLVGVSYLAQRLALNIFQGVMAL
jgi:hypothetical protein